MLVYPINATSVQESNIFLRKLWSELNLIKPLGWELVPHKVKDKVFIGWSTFGEISYDYIRKGCIKNLYIDNSTDEDAISNAVQCARKGKLKEYSVRVELQSNKEIKIAETAYEKCKIYSKEGKVFFVSGFKSYSDWDISQVLPSKFLAIRSVLYEYVRVLFCVGKIECSKEEYVCEVIEHNDYDYSWIDLDDRPQIGSGEYILPSECMRLISYIMNDESYDDDIELLLNSSNLLLTTDELYQEIDYPFITVKADIFNTMACSSLEPLALIINKRSDRCKECGNMVFSITKKIRDVCTRYFGDAFAKYVSDEFYKKRSVFLHNGYPETTQQSTSYFCPQINPITGIVMMPHGLVKESIFDYSSFLFRNMAHDLFSGELRNSCGTN